MTRPARNIKQLAHELVDQLPDDATWPDLIECAAERQDIIERQYFDDFDNRFVDESILQEYGQLEAARVLEEAADPSHPDLY